MHLPMQKLNRRRIIQANSFYLIKINFYKGHVVQTRIMEKTRLCPLEKLYDNLPELTIQKFSIKFSTYAFEPIKYFIVLFHLDKIRIFKGT